MPNSENVNNLLTGQKNHFVKTFSRISIQFVWLTDVLKNASFKKDTVDYLKDF